MTLDYGINMIYIYIYLTMGNAGFISSTVCLSLDCTWLEAYHENWRDLLGIHQGAVLIHCSASHATSGARMLE